MSRVIAFDTETHLIAPGNQAPKVVCLSWCDNGNAGHLVHHLDIEQWFADNVIGKDVVLVAHNAAFDALALMRSYPSLRKCILDLYAHHCIKCTQVRERLLRVSRGIANQSMSLEVLGLQYLNKQLDKGGDGWRLRYKELEDKPLDEWPKRAVDYAIEDAVTCLQVYGAQEMLSEQYSYPLPTHDFEVRADLALTKMTARGLHTDPKPVMDLWLSIKKEIDQIKESLKGVVLKSNKNGTEWTKDLKTIRSLIEKSYPGEPPRSGTQKLIQTTAEVLEECDNPDLKNLVRYNKLSKLKVDYVDKMIKGVREPIHPRYYVLGARSSRTSCTKPNIQNQPRRPGLRECYVPRKGFLFLACDFDSQEMRTLAQTLLDTVDGTTLANKYNKDRYYDPHLDFAASIMQISIDEARERLKQKDKEVKDMRQTTKMVNFGFMGGMEPKGFVKYAKGFGVTLSLDRAEELQELWFNQIPEMRLYLAGCERIASTQNEFKIPKSGFIRSDITKYSAANGFVQGLGAHASKQALWDVTYKCMTTELMSDCHPVIFIHDEIILEVPEHKVHEVALEVESTMIASMEKWTPDVPAAASAVAMRRWSKNAERVLENGKLVAWDG